jgi:hypothetical protein
MADDRFNYSLGRTGKKPQRKYLWISPLDVGVKPDVPEEKAKNLRRRVGTLIMKRNEKAIAGEIHGSY